ncbi:MAG: hypothetical protein HZC37_26015 [Burkholderiales bacterium]|nr:hypothetical protein [Burkholderiales bacterium]
MDETLTRKHFCGNLLAAWAALALPGCGGGGDYGSTPAPPPVPPGATCGSVISDNHGHVLEIERADLDSTTDKTYDIRGSSGHTHQVVLTPTQLSTLKAGGTISVFSSVAELHAHAVSVACV